MRFILLLPLALLVLFICTTNNACTKDPQIPVTPVDSLPHDSTTTPDNFTVSNEWECTIDGITYKGAVDTSFMQLFSFYSTMDSLVVATGTSADNKAHIHFKAAMNRTTHPLS